jgi:aryl-alcohol dehydrogenase-like predicted oxidoreductase
VPKIAESCRSSKTQIALAWLLSRAGNVFAIPGTRRIEHLEANAAAADIALTPDEISALDAAILPGAAEGTRYPAAQMAVLER